MAFLSFLAQLPTPRNPKEAVEALPGVAKLLERRLVELVPAAIVAALLLLFFWGLARLVGKVLDKAFDKAQADPAVRGLTTRLSRFFIILLGWLLAARQMGLEVGSLVAGLGIVGLAVGLAAQDLLTNLIAGFTILWDRPFRVGDWVTIGQTQGTVLEIGLRTTRLRLPDHRRLILPNRDVISGPVINHTMSTNRRLHLKVAIGYEQPLAPVRLVLLEIARAHPEVLDEPPPEVLVTGFVEDAVDTELRVRLRDAHLERRVRFELFEAIKERFDRERIEFPGADTTIRVVTGGSAGDEPAPVSGTAGRGIKSPPNPPPALGPP